MAWPGVALRLCAGACIASWSDDRVVMSFCALALLLYRRWACGNVPWGGHRGTSPARHTLSYTAHRSKYTYDSVGFRGVVSITDGLSVPADKSTVIVVLGLCVSPEVRGKIEIAISMPLHWHLDLG